MFENPGRSEQGRRARSAILYAMQLANQPLRVAELAKKVGLSVGTTHHHLLTLKRAGAVKIGPCSHCKRGRLWQVS